MATALRGHVHALSSLRIYRARTDWRKGYCVSDDGAPNEGEERYMDDPTYLESRFGVLPVLDLRSDPSVIGIVRLVIMPSFSGESINTFVFGNHEVTIEIRLAERSLWYSLHGDYEWLPPEPVVLRRRIGDLPPPLNNWVSLKEVARSAPSVRTAIVDGQEFACLDGGSYGHRLVDADADLSAKWSNPIEEASNHISQVRLVKAYDQVLRMGRG
jgi:hypothetical protein